MKTLRACCIRLHRWFGLASAAFLVLVGLTGSVLAYYEELDAWVNPRFLAQVRPGEPRLDLATLAERAQDLAPEVQVMEATWRYGGRQAEIRTRPWPDSDPSFAPGFDSILLDPWTGAQLGRRTWGDIRQGWVNLIPFLYRLHYELALGHPGMVLLGLVALGWTADCFVGLILTLPAIGWQSRCQRRKSTRGWWIRWLTAWRIKHPASGTRRLFDLHRAFSLWCWMALLVFAWSSVLLNLPSVYEPVMLTLTGYTPPAVSIIQASGKRGDAERGLSWRQALEQGRHLMSYQARSLGFTVQREIMLRFIPRDEAWLYRTHGSRDVLHRRGATDLYFDAHTGRLRALQLPTGEGAGQAVTSWLYALHVADVWGWPLRVVVLILGVVLAMLSMTGVLIWRRKRMAENRSAGE